MMINTDDQPRDLDTQIEAWRQHVEKIDAERDLQGAEPEVANDPTVWGAHDLPAALYIRDRIQLALADSVPDDRAQYEQELSRVDERFRAITVEDESRMLDRLLGEDLSGRQWWWYRIPTSGPIIDELRADFA